MDSMQRIAIASDLNLFTRHLGFKNGKPQNRIYPYLQDPDVRRFIAILPPGHSKSTCCTVNYPCWEVGIDNDLRFIIACHSDRLVRAFIRQIRYTLTSESYIEIFNDLKPTHEIVGKGGVRKWSETELLIKRTSKSKDPTFAGYSTGEHIVGGRADRIICDDLIDQDDVNTVEQREKVWDWFRNELLTRLEPDGRIIVVGTRWHWDDLYNKLLTSSEYKLLQLKAITEDEDHKLHALWPERWPLDILLARKKSMGSAGFECQYQGNPTPTEGGTLKREWINHWTTEGEDKPHRIYKLPSRDKLQIYQAWDLAISEDPHADWTVGLTLGVDMEGGLYLLDYVRDHWDFPTQMKKVEEQARLWRPLKIAIESNAYQKALPQALRGGLLPVVEVKQTKNKIMRIQELAPYFENGTMRISPSQDEFLLEYLQFPKGEHEDILDALHLAFSHVKIPKFEPFTGIIR